VCFWGTTGVGKDYVQETIAAENDMAYFALFLGQMADAGDITGLPSRSDEGETVYLTPPWLRAFQQHAEANDNEVKGLLHLSEVNRGVREVTQATFQLMRGRQVYTHHLPPGVIVTASANPPTRDYDVAEVYDKAFLARFAHIAFQPTPQEWLAFAASQGVDWSIRTMIADDPKFLGQHAVSVPEVTPNPWAWTKMDELTRGGLDTDLLEEIATGLVGPSAAAAWMNIKNSPDRPVKASDVLNKYEAVRPTVQKYASPESYRADLLHITMDDVCAAALKWGPNVPPEGMANLATFLLDCPEDLAYGAFKTKLHAKASPALAAALSQQDKLVEFVIRVNREVGIRR